MAHAAAGIATCDGGPRHGAHGDRNKNIRRSPAGTIMRTEQQAPGDIDEYIAGFPEEVQEILRTIRAMIGKAAPGAEEAISHGIPTFNLNGACLVYFAAYRNHISLYPAPVGHPEFEKEMAVDGSGKGTMKFPLDTPIPYDIVRRLVKFRIRENATRVAAKRRKKEGGLSAAPSVVPALCSGAHDRSLCPGRGVHRIPTRTLIGEGTLGLSCPT